MNETGGLKTLESDGSLPVTRMESALSARARVDQFIRADNAGRSFKRNLIKGLVDGNSPYEHTDLVSAGRADMTNVNFRIAEAYLSTSLSSYYDIFTQTPTYALVQTEFGKGQRQTDWSEILTEEFDCLLKKDRYLDYEMQCSQYDMVLYGCGPMLFRSALDWRPRFNQCGMLLVPEYSKSKTEEWEEAAYRIYYTPSDLYQYIRYPQTAAKLGWNIQAVKDAIMFAHPRTREGGIYNNWEWHQQRLKNNSFSYSAESNAIHVGHYFYREYPMGDEEAGAITHTMIDMSGNSNSEYLYKRERKYSSWDAIVHPMYADHGGGGFHHSVVGLGVKMYGALAFQNRLLCNLSDKAFAPKIMFKPTSANADQQLQLARFGDFARIPNGFELQQVQSQGHLEEALAFNQVLNQLVNANLAQYRRDTRRVEGNPITATQVQEEATQQATLSETGLNLYLAQLDWLLQEVGRRAFNPNYPRTAPGAKLALEMQKRCLDRGVPKEAMHKVVINASRTIGQGNRYLRKQALSQLLAIMPRLPQEGQERLIRDFVAAQSGFSMAHRYAPKQDKGALPSESEMLVSLQIAGAKTGVPPVVCDEINAVVAATLFLHASAEVLAGVEQAGPQAIGPAVQLLELLGPAIAGNLKRFENDPTRKGQYDALSQQFQRMSGLTDKLAKMFQQQQQQAQKNAQMQQRAQQMVAGQNPEMQLAAAKTRGELGLKREKMEGDMALKEQKNEQNLSIKARQTRQNLSIKDLTTAQTLRHNEAKTDADLQAKKTKEKESAE